MTKTDRKVRIFGRIFFVLYMILALYFMFFSETLDRTMVSDEYRYNLTLFKEINRFWNMRYTYGWDVTIVNLLGNVVCFMPFGFLLPTVSKKKIFKNFLSVTLMAMLFSLGIETAQLLMKVGAFDVDDIFLNTVGGLVGYIFMKLTRVRKHI
ncbi:MAG: VanZ family protein [Eubacterium sp.]|nr:VanZ family protein [Eubacterium sp.]